MVTTDPWPPSSKSMAELRQWLTAGHAWRFSALAALIQDPQIELHADLSQCLEVEDPRWLVWP
jgi:hypothetical protein